MGKSSMADVSPSVSSRFEFLADSFPRLGVGGAICVGFLITAVQILVACMVSGQSQPARAYATLCAWDGGWYAGIVHDGYRSPPVLSEKEYGNVAFFPGYPLAAQSIRLLFGLSIETALLVTAQLACVGMWTFFLLHLRRRRIPPGLAAVAILLVLVHPAAFFLVASYTESLFLFALLGFLYWADRDQPAAFVFACGFGILMTATRLVGVPLAVYPLFRAWLCRTRGGDPAKRWGWQQAVRPLLIGSITMLGALSFFAYCHFRFGHWDIYMKTEEVGWGVHPDYFALFSERIFHIHWPSLHEPGGDGEFLSRLSVPLTVILFTVFLILEWRHRRVDPPGGWRERAGYYLCAALMFYICVSGHGTRGMSSMVRFALPVQVMLVLAGTDFARSAWEQGRFDSRRALVSLIAWCTLSLACQLGMTYRFTHWLWVA